LDEYSLIISAQKGEKEAFQSLIISYYPYVSKFLCGMCEDKTLSEDLTQETFIKLIRGIELFDIHGSASFATYVMTVAKNCYIDYLRINKRILLNLDDQEIISDNLQDAVIDTIETEEIFKILKQLPPEQAEAIKLKYMERCTLQEIAQRFHCEPKTIKSRIHNGITKLRQALKGDSNDR
jgi:RNA polymerase sigma-70 factor (ECF subfamily)